MACTMVPYGCDGQARGLRWMTSPGRRPTEVLLDITTEGGVSFHVSTHLGRDETVGKVDGTLEVLTIPVSDVDRSQAFCQRRVEGCRRRPLDSLDIVKLRRRPAVQARCLQN